MTTYVLDEHRCSSQALSYESAHEPVLHSSTTTTTTTTTVLGTPSISSATTNRRVKYSTQTSLSSPRPSAASIHQRHAGPTDILSIIRSIAMKPFRTASMTDAVAGGQTSNVIGGSIINDRTSVNLLRYRPLSDVLIDQNSYTQSTHAVEDFLKRMEWSVQSTSDEARMKWNTAMKFLIPAKFDVSRAIELYRAHENIRKIENLDHIWINNPHLIRELQSSTFVSLPQIANRPMVIVFTVSNLTHSTSMGSLSLQDRELIAFQAFICQLDAVTESLDVQQNGLNFIYDMQQCSASQFEMNLSKKVLKLVQAGYPAVFKNVFIIAAPKWFRAVNKVTLHTTDQMRQYLTVHYRYSLDTIPISLGGTFDPTLSDTIQYQMCLSKVKNSQSICSPYYSTDYQPLTTKATSHIVFFNTDHDKSAASPRTKGSSSSSSLVAIVSLKPNAESSSSSQMRVHKRESSSSSDHDKRQRSNESLIEEELPAMNHSVLRKGHSTDQLTSNEHHHRQHADQQEATDNNNIRLSMLENRNRDTKRLPTKASYKAMTDVEFLSKTQEEIRQEFRKMPNPPAKDTHAAKAEKNLDKSRYRDVIPGELTRIKLQPDTDDKHDFINANYVTGYNKQDKAYIFTQGPLQSTVRDFWRMIWQETIAIIVMTTNLRESGTLKCHPYWPSETDECLNVGSYQIQKIQSEKYDSFVITTLTLKKANQADIRTVYHAHYLKWPDHGIPNATKDALLFLEKVESYRQLTKTKAPVLLHCSAGIGRTGTFCAIDIGIQRYLDTKMIDIASTVVKMRHERAGSVQTEDQYVFVHLALMDYIKQHERVTSNSQKSVESESEHKSPSIQRHNSLSQRKVPSSDSPVSPTATCPNESSEQLLSTKHMSSTASMDSQEHKNKDRK